MARYLVNAGPLAADSWYRNEELEGSRFTGEGGHFIDTLSWWADSLPEEVYAVPGPEHDDLQATVRFQNGSSGTRSPTSRPATRAIRRRRWTPRPAAGAHGSTTSSRLPSGPGGAGTPPGRAAQDKGQRYLVAQFVEACRTGAPMPIALESLVATTRATIAVGESLASGRPERV